MAVGAQPLLSPGEDLVDEPQCWLLHIPELVVTWLRSTYRRRSRSRHFANMVFLKYNNDGLPQEEPLTNLFLLRSYWSIHTITVLLLVDSWTDTDRQNPAHSSRRTTAVCLNWAKQFTYILSADGVCRVNFWRNCWKRRQTLRSFARSAQEEVRRLHYL